MQYNNKQVNEVYIQISGKFPIEKLLEQEDIEVKVLLGHAQDKVQNMQDGTVNIIHVFKPLSLSLPEQV